MQPQGNKLSFVFSLSLAAGACVRVCLLRPPHALFLRRCPRHSTHVRDHRGKTYVPCLAKCPNPTQAQLGGAGPWRFGWHLLRLRGPERGTLAGSPGGGKRRLGDNVSVAGVRPRSFLTHSLTHIGGYTFTADSGGCSFKRRATPAQHTCPATATMSGCAGTAQARLCARSPMRREARGRGLGGAQAQTAQLQWQLSPASGIGIPRQQPTIGQQRLQTCEERLIMLTKCLAPPKARSCKHNGQNCQCKLNTTMS